MSVDNILFYNYRGQLCNAVTRSIRKSYVCDVMAPTHPLLRYKAEICSIEFRAEKQATEEKPLTKREKHIRVDPKTVLCRINLSDDEPEWRGHIAVIYRYNKSKNDMQYLTFDDYKEKKSSKMLLCDNLTATFAK
ncbi:Transcription factor TOXE [Trichinella pseudospiralis]